MPNSLAKTLIERACINAGSAVELSKMLGVKPQRITQWKNGHLKCQPDDLAAIAAIAGYNALNVLAAATLEATEGTAKGAVLDAALGKAMKATGYASNGGSTPQNSLKDQLIQCILCKVDQTHVARASKKLKALTERKKRSSLTD